MLPYRESTLTKAALVLFFIFIAGYAYFEARGILFGPSIQVAATVEQVSTPYVELTGTTSHIATLSINGQSVPVTEAGTFDIPFALSPGFNRAVLDATDKYGHSTEKVLQIVYTPSTNSTSSPQASPGQALATTTQGTATTTSSTGSTSSRQASSSQADSGRAAATSTLAAPSASSGTQVAPE